jgi:hypothetical protein
VRTFEGQWTPRAEARFLGALPRTCNLRIACEEAGMTLSSYEAHRRRWPDFRRRVEAVLAIGRIRLAAALAAEAERPFDPWDLPEGETASISVAETIRILRRRRRRR